MVGTPLVIVKKRDGQFTLSFFSFLFSSIIFKGRPQRSLIARVGRGESSTARSANTRECLELARSRFLDWRARAMLA